MREKLSVNTLKLVLEAFNKNPEPLCFLACDLCAAGKLSREQYKAFLRGISERLFPCSFIPEWASYNIEGYDPKHKNVYRKAYLKAWIRDMEESTLRYRIKAFAKKLLKAYHG